MKALPDKWCFYQLRMELHWWISFFFFFKKTCMYMSLKLHLFFSCFPGLTNKFDSKIHLRNIYIYIFNRKMNRRTLKKQCFWSNLEWPHVLFQPWAATDRSDSFLALVIISELFFNLRRLLCCLELMVFKKKCNACTAQSSVINFYLPFYIQICNCLTYLDPSCPRIQQGKSLKSYFSCYNENSHKWSCK